MYVYHKFEVENDVKVKFNRSPITYSHNPTFSPFYEYHHVWHVKPEKHAKLSAPKHSETGAIRPDSTQPRSKIIKRLPLFNQYSIKQQHYEPYKVWIPVLLIKESENIQNWEDRLVTFGYQFYWCQWNYSLPTVHLTFQLCPEGLGVNFIPYIYQSIWVNFL